MNCFVILEKINKRVRQYAGIIVAILIYYALHEGAHFICAFLLGVFKQINIMGIGTMFIYYNPKGYRIEGFDEFYYVNER